MRLIDLFAGLGGFHLALKQLGHTCVFASEIDADLREIYNENFGIMPEGDIQEVNVESIPHHQILCAGFPCQPFSKAGQQDGLNHPKLGKLYQSILDIIHFHHPQFFILENVPNFEMHDEKKTWRHIRSLLENEGYEVSLKKLSPHSFNIPQIRERVYIVGSLNGLDNFEWPTPPKFNEQVTVENYLEHNPKNARKVPEYVNRCLDVWQEFLNKIPHAEKIPHPLWSMEFGATYPFEKTTPSMMSFDELKHYRGTHGQPLSDASDLKQMFSLLPSHARRNQDVFPKWKIRYIKKNREFYERHKSWLDEWIPKIHKFSSSLQKLEWNCQSEKNRNIRNYILQMRPSGVRVKRRTTIPSLVAMTSTQVPIIAWENRYVTPFECLRLQSMDGPNGLKVIPKLNNKAYKAFGNAINVKVALLVTEALVGKESLPNEQEQQEQISMPIPLSG
jgi:DNA (cytosine-5)-methyltransferase 1